MKLLVIDDDPDIRLVARMMLEAKPGTLVAEAGTREEALDRVSSLQPDVILLDYQLGDDKGDEVLEAIRRLPSGEKAKVIFITASITEAFRQTLLQSSAIGVLQKPLDLDTFADQVFRLVNA